MKYLILFSFVMLCASSMAQTVEDRLADLEREVIEAKSQNIRLAGVLTETSELMRTAYKHNVISWITGGGSFLLFTVAALNPASGAVTVLMVGGSVLGVVSIVQKVKSYLIIYRDIPALLK